MAIAAACSRVGGLEADDHVVDLLGAVLRNKVQRFFQIVAIVGVGTDGVTAGGLGLLAEIIIFLIAVVAQLFFGNAKQIQLPVYQTGAVAAERGAAGIALGCFVCRSDLIFDLLDLQIISEGFLGKNGDQEQNRQCQGEDPQDLLVHVRVVLSLLVHVNGDSDRIFTNTTLGIIAQSL